MSKKIIFILGYAIMQTMLILACKAGIVPEWVAVLPLYLVVAVFLVCLFIAVFLAAKQVKEKMKNEN